MKRTFLHTTEAWWAKDWPYLWDDPHMVDELMIGFPESNDVAEFVVRWFDLGSSPPIPRVGIFQGSWGVFELGKDLFARLSECYAPIMSPQVFIDLLLELGFEDVTPRGREENHAR